VRRTIEESLSERGDPLVGITIELLDAKGRVVRNVVEAQ
jgi:hypothetical protein